MDVKAQEKQNEIVRRKMLDVRDMKIMECPTDSPWIRPIRLHYQQDGERRDWDVVKVHDGVSVIIFNTSRKKLVFVRQFRPAFLYTILPEACGPVDLEKYPPKLGLSLELCAGIVDKDQPLVEIARDELREECGYEAPAETFKFINTFRYTATAVYKNTLFYVEVTDEMHIHPGGGAASEGELIEVVDMSIPEVKEYIDSEELQSPPSFLYGFTWFLLNKPEHCS
ncbi:PREDICTED: uridine diphosphate glucose pyrophosphatase-like [Dufourea novaeangliae]|uniref:Uridine diphosphate glucose pyrophosphatase NUDT14 n=1 Tax=Dufourea novaeangliae TaxID=178035 RepID=A0A154P5W4_DUFNO|nr:PREDICTED: uridine diphosphate glucose pyrophosphatase-like [Dufourea novaeangliae]KZC06530.1 Uridine diphosphate glucose pyrophosphatase [Dufourea novaeangliae]